MDGGYERETITKGYITRRLVCLGAMSGRQTRAIVEPIEVQFDAWCVVGVVGGCDVYHCEEGWPWLRVQGRTRSGAGACLSRLDTL